MMNNVITLGLILVFALAVPLSAKAEDYAAASAPKAEIVAPAQNAEMAAPEQETATAPNPAGDATAVTEAAGPKEVGNKLCPVSGEEVGTMGDVVKKEYKGKVYNLCCSMCAKDFDKDPDRFVKIADDEVKTDAVANP